MFTGIIEDIGDVKQVTRGATSAELVIASKKITAGLNLGDSVAVNGVCLTVTRFDESTFAVDAVPETMTRSNLGSLKQGDHVNLERALRVGDRLGGHMVSGHVDAAGTVTSVRKEENAVWFVINLSDEMIKYLVPKGSVALNGISLTVVDVTEDTFSVSVIPHSLKETTLSELGQGDRVNIEVDMTAKYIERFLKYRNPGTEKKSVSMDYLKDNGFV